MLKIVWVSVILECCECLIPGMSSLYEQHAFLCVFVWWLHVDYVTFCVVQIYSTLVKVHTKNHFCSVRFVLCWCWANHLIEFYFWWRPWIEWTGCRTLMHENPENPHNGVLECSGHHQTIMDANGNNIIERWVEKCLAALFSCALVYLPHSSLSYTFWFTDYTHIHTCFGGAASFSRRIRCVLEQSPKIVCVLVHPGDVFLFYATTICTIGTYI